MNKIIAILSISLLVLGGCTTKQVAEAPINTVEETTVKETTERETTIEKATIETTKVEETTVVEETNKSMLDIVKEEWEGKTRADFKLDYSANSAKSDELWDNGICLVYNNDANETIMVLTLDETKKFYEDIASEKMNYECNFTNDKSKELFESIRKDYKNKQSEAQAEAFSSEVSSHIKSGSGVATVINDLNPYGYTINNLGYVVPTEDAYKHMQTLKSGEFNLYRQTELEVFKKNNAGKVTITNKQNEDYSGTQGTFNSWGHPSWVCREPNFQTTNALGGTVYAVCDNTLEEFRPYCDGTLIAFKGWHEKSYDPNSAMWYYNNRVLDSNLGAFVDWNWEWIGEAGERKFRKVN